MSESNPQFIFVQMHELYHFFIIIITDIDSYYPNRAVVEE